MGIDYDKVLCYCNSENFRCLMSARLNQFLLCLLLNVFVKIVYDYII